jgi:hypothetical protein
MKCYLQNFIILTIISLTICEWKIKALHEDIKNIIFRNEGIIINTRPEKILTACNGDLTFSYQKNSDKACLLGKITFSDQRLNNPINISMYEPDQNEPLFNIPVVLLDYKGIIDLTEQARKIAENNIEVVFDVSTSWRDIKTKTDVIISANRLEMYFTEDVEEGVNNDENLLNPVRQVELTELKKLIKLKSVLVKHGRERDLSKRLVTLPQQQFSWIFQPKDSSVGIPVSFKISVEQMEDFFFTFYFNLDNLGFQYFKDIRVIKGPQKGGKKRHLKRRIK